MLDSNTNLTFHTNLTFKTRKTSRRVQRGESGGPDPPFPGPPFSSLNMQDLSS